MTCLHATTSCELPIPTLSLLCSCEPLSGIRSITRCVKRMVMELSEYLLLDYGYYNDSDDVTISFACIYKFDMCFQPCYSISIALC